MNNVGGKESMNGQKPLLVRVSVAPAMVGHQYILHCPKTADVICTLSSIYDFYLVFILVGVIFYYYTYPGYS